MGTFANFTGGMSVPEEKRDQFSERVMTILQQGGMMQTETVKLFEKDIILLSTPKLDEEGKVWVEYNYFEDDFWEPAGYHADNSKVWSNKIGDFHFCKVICALYMLYEFYVGDGVTLLDGLPVRTDRIVGWFKHLFRTAYVDTPIREKLLGAHSSKENQTGAERLSTAEFLHCTDDDRAYWWQANDGDVWFSLSMREWLAGLRRELREISEDGDELIAPKDFPQVFITLLSELNKDFGRIYAFRDMFYDFLTNSNCREYQAAVVLLQRLAERHRKEGAVIHELSHWTYGDPQIKYNAARMCIKRYLAVLANMNLRQYLFGHSIPGEWRVKPVKYWEGRTPPADYYAPVSPYKEPPKWNINLRELSRYARSVGKDIIDLTYDEIRQFETETKETEE